MISGILLAIVQFVILVLMLWFCVYLFDKYILPLIPKTWVKYLSAILALVIIIWILDRFFGLHL